MQPLVIGGGFVVLAEALAGSIAFQERWIDPLLGAGGSDVLARTLRDGGIAIVVLLTALVLHAEHFMDPAANTGGRVTVWNKGKLLGHLQTVKVVP